jgi:hypothetical protein
MNGSGVMAKIAGMESAAKMVGGFDGQQRNE